MTDDLIILGRLEGKLDHLSDQLTELEKRLRVVERAHPGGRWAKVVERGILVALTTMLGWQNIAPQSYRDNVPIMESRAATAPLNVNTSTLTR